MSETPLVPHVRACGGPDAAGGGCGGAYLAGWRHSPPPGSVPSTADTHLWESEIEAAGLVPDSEVWVTYGPCASCRVRY